MARAERYVAFLRAINVAGHATVKMTDVRDAFAAAGCRNVRTIIQSGNIVFDAAASGRATLAKRICQQLEPLIGKDPAVFIRTHGDLAAMVESDPFRTHARGKDVKLYVAFLGGKPLGAPRMPLRDHKEAVEAISTNGNDVFLVSRRKSNGMYGFPNAFIEKAFGVAATTRNWNTVLRITHGNP